MDLFIVLPLAVMPGAGGVGLAASVVILGISPRFFVIRPVIPASSQASPVS